MISDDYKQEDSQIINKIVDDDQYITLDFNTVQKQINLLRLKEENDIQLEKPQQEVEVVDENTDLEYLRQKYLNDQSLQSENNSVIQRASNHTSMRFFLDEPNTDKCVKWKKISFQDEHHLSVVPFEKWKIESSKTIVTESFGRLIFFNQCNPTEYYYCEQEGYYMNYLKYEQIGKIKKFENQKFFKLDGIYNIYDPNWPILVKFTTDIYSLDYNRNTKGILMQLQTNLDEDQNIQSLEFLPLYEQSEDQLFQSPFFRSNTNLAFIKNTVLRNSIQGETDFDILMIGGQNKFQTFDDINIFSFTLKKWVNVKIVEGRIPKIFGHTVHVFYDNIFRKQRFVIFGGQVDGVTSSKVFGGYLECDLQGNYEVSIQEIDQDYDFIPEPRQGHSGFIKGQELFILGGCNFARRKCFNDLFRVNLLSIPLKLIKIQPNSDIQPQELEGFALISLKNDMFYFNGCNQLGTCYKDSYKASFQDDCVFRCPPRQRLLPNGTCVCNVGLIGADCKIQQKECKFECNNNGICVQPDNNDFCPTCQCFAGYYGQYCESMYCPDNCGGPSNGVCNIRTGQCRCHNNNGKKMLGINCKGNCHKKCNNHGYCFNDKCICFEEFSGVDCEMQIGITGCWSFGESGTICLDYDKRNNNKKRLKGVVNFEYHGELFAFLEDQSYHNDTLSLPTKLEDLFRFSNQYPWSNNKKIEIKGRLYSIWNHTHQQTYKDFQERKIFLSGAKYLIDQTYNLEFIDESLILTFKKDEVSVKRIQEIGYDFDFYLISRRDEYYNLLLQKQNEDEKKMKEQNLDEIPQVPQVVEKENCACLNLKAFKIMQNLNLTNDFTIEEQNNIQDYLEKQEKKSQKKNIQLLQKIQDGILQDENQDILENDGQNSIGNRVQDDNHSNNGDLQNKNTNQDDAQNMDNNDQNNGDLQNKNTNQDDAQNMNNNDQNDGQKNQDESPQFLQIKEEISFIQLAQEILYKDPDSAYKNQQDSNSQHQQLSDQIDGDTIPKNQNSQSEIESDTTPKSQNPSSEIDANTLPKSQNPSDQFNPDSSPKNQNPSSETDPSSDQSNFPLESEKGMEVSATFYRDDSQNQYEPQEIIILLNIKKLQRLLQLVMNQNQTYIKPIFLSMNCECLSPPNNTCSCQQINQQKCEIGNSTEQLNETQININCESNLNLIKGEEEQGEEDVIVKENENSGVNQLLSKRKILLKYYKDNSLNNFNQIKAKEKKYQNDVGEDEIQTEQKNQTQGESIDTIGEKSEIQLIEPDSFTCPCDDEDKFLKKNIDLFLSMPPPSPLQIKGMNKGKSYGLSNEDDEEWNFDNHENPDQNQENQDQSDNLHSSNIESSAQSIPESNQMMTQSQLSNIELSQQLSNAQQYYDSDHLFQPNNDDMLKLVQKFQDIDQYTDSQPIQSQIKQDKQLLLDIPNPFQDQEIQQVTKDLDDLIKSQSISFIQINTQFLTNTSRVNDTDSILFDSIAEYQGSRSNYRQLGCINKKSCSGNGICDIDNNCLCTSGIGLYCDHLIETLYPDTVIDGNVDQNCEIELMVFDESEKEIEEQEIEEKQTESESPDLSPLEEIEEKIIVLKCPADCNEQGFCNTTTGKCECYLGFKGLSCLGEYCPFNCTLIYDFQFYPPLVIDQQGICNSKDQKCDCFDGYYGEGCENVIIIQEQVIEVIKQCPNNCSNQGYCDIETETCHCYDGYQGLDCQDNFCPNNCSISRTFKEGFCDYNEKICSCYPGYKGRGCDEHVNCPNNCTKINHGVCMPTGKCKCQPEFQGEHCGFRRCPNNCNKNGKFVSQFQFF